MKAVVLAGGFGKRLKPLTDQMPKPMIEVLGVPIIEWQIRWLRKFGVKDFILCVGHLSEQISNHIGDGSKFGAHVEYSVEEEPLGTGGALKNARNFLADQDSFFMLNGDVLTELDPNKLRVDNLNTIALVPLRSPFGMVELDGNSKVLGFVEKPEISGSWINAGVYRLTPEVFEFLPENGNIEVTALPALTEKGRLHAVKYQKIFWRSIDSHKDIEEAAKDMHTMQLP